MVCIDVSVTDSSMAGGPNSTFEGDDVTSPPTTAVGAGDNNTLSPVLSPTSDTEHTTGTWSNNANVFLYFLGAVTPVFWLM